MRIAFLDPSNWDYNADTPYTTPLGGSQSALCYLAEALARRGHDVFMISSTSQPGKFRGVECLALPSLERESLVALRLDVVVIFNVAQPAATLREWLGPTTRIVAWTQHDIDQPASQFFGDPGIRDVLDACVFVSDYQRQRYLEQFGLRPDQAVVQRNAVAPAFLGLFAPGESIREAKANPPVLTYTSTPFRGLDVLVEAFPHLRRLQPGLRLQVYSSLKVYLAQAAEDANFAELYDRCRQTEGIEYIGSLPQTELAGRLRSVAILAYPNTFPETSCIAVMEAMAAGCFVITSRLGALPETTAGFARLVDWHEDLNQFLFTFQTECDDVICDFVAQSPEAADARLREQVDFVNREYTWSNRAAEWEQWLTKLIAAARLPEAIQLHQAGRVAEALAIYREILAADGGNADALHLAGVAAFQNGHADNAVQLIQAAIAVNGNVAEFHNNLASVFVGMGRLEDAVNCCVRALTLNPTHAGALENLTDALTRQGRGDKAAEFRRMFSGFTRQSP